jgi:hypothetical protein
LRPPIMAASRRTRHEVGPQKTLPTVQSFGVFFGRRRQRLTGCRIVPLPPD